jgi:DNA-binding transcriptional regulator LsrR (DeoR family)
MINPKDQPGVSLTTGAIAKQLGVSRESIQRIVDNMGIVELSRAGSARIFSASHVDMIAKKIKQRQELRGEKP